MGGTSGKLEGRTLLELFKKFEKVRKGFENGGLFCDVLTLVFKNEEGKYIQLGSNNIATEANKLYGN